MTILDKLIYLEDTKAAIQQAIVAKGVPVSDNDPFRSYATFISQITSGGGVLPNSPLLRKVTCGETLSAGDIVLIARRKFPSTFSGPTLMADPEPISDATFTGLYDGALSGDGNFLITSKATSPYFISYKWNPATLKYVRTADPDTAARAENFSSMAVSSDGMYLAVCSGVTTPYIKTYKWNSSNNRYEATADPDYVYRSNCAAMTSNGQRLVIASQDSPYLFAYDWNETNNRYEKITNIAEPIEYHYAIQISSDGQYCVLFHNGEYWYNGRIFKWSQENGRYVLLQNISSSWTGSLFASGDCSTLAYTYHEGFYIATRSNDVYTVGASSIAGAAFPMPWGDQRGTAMCVSNDGTILVMAYGSFVPTIIMYLIDPVTRTARFMGAPSAAGSTVKPGRVMMTADKSRIVTLQNDTSTYRRVSVFDTSGAFTLPEYYAVKANVSIDPALLYGVGYMTEAGSAGALKNVTCLWLKNDVLTSVA